jgi:hypothetical protein
MPAKSCTNPSDTGGFGGTTLSICAVTATEQKINSKRKSFFMNG